jgi:hypothetical protein
MRIAPDSANPHVVDFANGAFAKPLGIVQELRDANGIASPLIVYLSLGRVLF